MLSVNSTDSLIYCLSLQTNMFILAWSFDVMGLHVSFTEECLLIYFMLFFSCDLCDDLCTLTTDPPSLELHCARSSSSTRSSETVGQFYCPTFMTNLTCFVPCSTQRYVHKARRWACIIFLAL